jgi:hypothetical protein
VELLQAENDVIAGLPAPPEIFENVQVHPIFLNVVFVVEGLFHVDVNSAKDLSD